MESATILTPPSTSLSGILLSSDPNIPKGPEFEKNINTILMHGREVLKIHMKLFSRP